MINFTWKTHFLVLSDKSEVPDIFKEDFFKNSDAFKHYNDFKSSRQSDNDLDGKIYADQLDALLKRVSPDFRGILPQEIPRTPKRKLRLTDDQKIMDMIHGTYKEEVFTPRPRPKKIPQRKTPSFNFDGTPIPTPPTASSRTWRTVISIRKPDGSYETRKTERNTDGSVVTTITKTEKDGRRVSETFNSDSNSKSSIMEKPNLGGENEEYDPEKNFRVCDGYKVPVLWWKLIWKLQLNCSVWNFKSLFTRIALNFDYSRRLLILNRHYCLNENLSFLQNY